MCTEMPISGSEEFIEELLNRNFPCASHEISIKSGFEINGHELCLKGFDKPILVKEQNGLRIRVPPSSFSPSDLLKYIDSQHVVDVIDVREQREVQMTLREFVENFNSEERTRLLNMLSLEFSKTRLSDLVQPPHVVSELSLITNCWVSDSFDDEESDDPSTTNTIPSVQKYCLVSMIGSYTDFHIDFGGSSVWYHVVWGEKIFYIIPPTFDNFMAYWNWSWHPDHRTIFFPDMLNPVGTNPDPGQQECRSPPVYQLRVLPGQTILLPSGWIHAVYTVSDCLVFGGNFLSELHIPTQLKVYQMEQKSAIPLKFQFPNFEKVHWFAADRIVGRLTNALYNEHEIHPYEVEAVQCLAKVLPRWYDKRRSLPVHERSYYLPDRTTLELPWSCLIDRLCDLARAFTSSTRKAKKSERAETSTTSDSRPGSSVLHPAGDDDEDSAASQSSWKIPVKSGSGIHSCDKSPGHNRSGQRQGFPASCRTTGGGGLGWMPDRTAKHKSQETAQSPHPVTDDQDVLDAVPELNSSRLMGDHYFLRLSDSEEEDEEQGSPTKTKRSRSSQKNRNRAHRRRDPDPTWSATNPNSKRSGQKHMKTINQLLSSTTSKTPLAALSLTGGGLHPLLQGATASSPSSQFDRTKSSDAESKTKRSRSKSNTTVRQRLAKRLGL